MVETARSVKTKEKTKQNFYICLRRIDKMAYVHTRNYFDFKGKRYGIGTIVKIKHGGMYTSKREIDRCNGIAEFKEGLDSGYLKFSGIIPPGTGYCGLLVYGNPEDSIEEIIEPVYYENKPTWKIAMDNYAKTPRSRRADIAPGTIFYIAAMLVGAIFKGAIAIWVIATFVYLKYLINIYRD
jgi:hypothetical protein